MLADRLRLRTNTGRDPEPRDEAEEITARRETVAALRDELAAYVYYVATLKEFFGEQLDGAATAATPRPLYTVCVQLRND